MGWKSDNEKEAEIIKKIVLDYFYTHKNFPKKITHKSITFKIAYFEFGTDDDLKCVVYEEENDYKEKNMITRISFIILWGHIAIVNPKLRNKNDRSYYRRSSHKV